jgi:hypothetical protein
MVALMPVQAPVSSTASQNRAAAECRSVAGILPPSDKVAKWFSTPDWSTGFVASYPYYDRRLVEDWRFADACPIFAGSCGSFLNERRPS